MRFPLVIVFPWKDQEHNISPGCQFECLFNIDGPSTTQGTEDKALSVCWLSIQLVTFRGLFGPYRSQTRLTIVSPAEPVEGDCQGPASARPRSSLPRPIGSTCQL